MQFPSVAPFSAPPMQCMNGGNCQQLLCLPCQLNKISMNTAKMPEAKYIPPVSSFSIAPKKRSSNRKSWFTANSQYLQTCNSYAPISLKYQMATTKDLIEHLEEDLTAKMDYTQSRIEALAKKAAETYTGVDTRALREKLAMQMSFVQEKLSELQGITEDQQRELRRRQKAGSRRIEIEEEATNGGNGEDKVDEVFEAAEEKPARVVENPPKTVEKSPKAIEKVRSKERKERKQLASPNAVAGAKASRSRAEVQVNGAMETVNAVMPQADVWIADSFGQAQVDMRIAGASDFGAGQTAGILFGLGTTAMQPQAVQTAYPMELGLGIPAMELGLGTTAMQPQLAAYPPAFELVAMPMQPQAAFGYGTIATPQGMVYPPAFGPGPLALQLSAGYGFGMQTQSYAPVELGYGTTPTQTPANAQISEAVVQNSDAAVRNLDSEAEVSKPVVQVMDAAGTDAEEVDWTAALADIGWETVVDAWGSF